MSHELIDRPDLSEFCNYAHDWEHVPYFQQFFVPLHVEIVPKSTSFSGQGSRKDWLIRYSSLNLIIQAFRMLMLALRGSLPALYFSTDSRKKDFSFWRVDVRNSPWLQR